METDKNPTFAEALLACAFHVNSGVYRTELDCLERARNTVRTAPPAIRRALGVDGVKLDSKRCPFCQSKTSHPPECPMSQLFAAQNRASDLESDLAAAVARAERAEEQMRHDGEARRMEEAGRASAIEAMCASERELDALRAELEEAMVSRSGLEAYSRQMAKDRDKWNAQCAAAEIECAKLRSERDSLRAELDKAKAELAHVEKTLATYNLVGPVGSRVAAVVESREFQTSRAVQMESERDALAAKLADKEAARVRIYKELIAYQHERDRLAVILDRAGRVLDEVAAREARLDAKEHG